MKRKIAFKNKNVIVNGFTSNSNTHQGKMTHFMY